MTCTIVRIDLPPQAGKTLLAISMLKGLKHTAPHIRSLYVAPSQEHAKRIVRIYGEMFITGEKLGHEHFDYTARVVVIDESERSGYTEDDIALIVKKLELHAGPTQLILFNTSSENQTK